MKKKEIKELLSGFGEIKMPDEQKIISSCGAEYRYVPWKSERRARRKKLAPALIAAIIIMIASAVTVAANSEGVQEMWRYVESKIRVFYGDGSYRDEVIGGYVPTSTNTGPIGTSAQTQLPPGGIIQNPEYWDKHKKDVSGYTAIVTHIQTEGERIVLHINGGEKFKIYKNYVKLERREKNAHGSEWENIFERLMPSYGTESGNTTAPTTGVYDGEGSFAANIDGLAELLENDGADCEYRITVKVCSHAGEMDEGDISIKFDLNDFD